MNVLDVYLIGHIWTDFFWSF